MKYWYLNLHIQVGEYEFYSKSVHKTKDNEDFDAEEYAKDFYGGNDDPDDENYTGTYYFNGGEVAVQVYDCHSITKKAYDTLRNFL